MTLISSPLKAVTLNDTGRALASIPLDARFYSCCYPVVLPNGQVGTRGLLTHPPTHLPPSHAPTHPLTHSPTHPLTHPTAKSRLLSLPASLST